MKNLLLLSFLLVLLAGCVDYNEELWLNSDGSGRAKTTIGVLTSYHNAEEINRYSTLPGIHLISKSVYRKKNYTYYNIEFTFDNLDAFNNLNDEISITQFIGRISLDKNKKGKIEFKRRIALGSPAMENDEIEQLILTLPHQDLKWSYKLHLPWRIIEANTSKEKISFQNSIVTWNYQTSMLWNKPQIMTVIMKKPFPALSLYFIALAAIIIILSLIWWRRNTRRKLVSVQTPTAVRSEEFPPETPESPQQPQSGDSDTEETPSPEEENTEEITKQ